jgi:type IV secretory pathway VirB10-like protein
MKILSNLKSRLTGILAGSKTLTQQVAELDPGDRAAFDALPPLERAKVLVGEGAELSKSAQIAALYEMGEVAEARKLQGQYPGAIKPAAVTTPPVAATLPAKPAVQTATPSPAAPPPTAAVTPKAAIPAPVAISPPKQPLPAAVLTGREKAAAAISAQINNAASAAEQRKIAEAAKEKARVEAQQELCKMAIEFDGLHSQEARGAYWLLHREKIEGLAKIETVRGTAWIGGFVRRR